MKSAIVLLFVLANGLSAAVNPVIEGNARFTVITPQCIRIEYAPGGIFTDARSLFAFDREARWNGFETKQEGGALTIDTGAMRLVYRPDGAPFHPGNLTTDVRIGNTSARWTPGAPNPGNLGGTIRTLDNVRGPVDLGEGLLSRDGWYLLDDSKRPLLTNTWVKSRPADSGTDWYLFGYGRDYKAALASMITIGGKAPVPRRYAMGTWFSRYWAFTDEDYRNIIREYREKNFPLDVIVMDMDWHRDGWTGWSWNKKLIPDPKGLLRWFHEQGLQVTLNLHPADGVSPHEDRYPQFMNALGEDAASGKTLPFDAGDERYIAAWDKEVLRPLQEDGVDFWWLDWQQYPFTRSIPDLTNLFWLNRVLFDSTKWNGERGTSFSRWAGWGDHRHVIQFSGDADTGWPMLSFQVPFTSTAGNVGCYYWSHDIGGHQGGRNEESYTRWTQFGALSAALRSHSMRDATMDRRPWLYPKWAEDSMRVAFHLRAELMPYVYSSAWQTHRTGISLNRPLYLDYPEHEPAYHNGQEFLFGDHLLAAPVTMPGTGPDKVGRQTVWFPPGDTWYDFFTGEKFEGGQTRIVSADINEFPLYARGGAPIVMQPYHERPGTAALETLRVRCYPGAGGEYTLHEDDGRSDAYQDGKSASTKLRQTRNGDHVSIEISPTEGIYQGQPERRAYVIELPNTTRLTEVTMNGQPAAVEHGDALGMNRILIPATDIRTPITILATAPEAPAAIFAKRALDRRVKGVMGDAAGETDLMTLIQRGDLAPETHTALLALAGVGLMPYHESPTFHGEKPQLAFIAQAGVIERDAVRKVAESTTQGKFAQSTGVQRIGKEPILLDADVYGRIEFRIAGKDHELATRGLQMTGNLAASARITASSSEHGHVPESAVDGLLGGYPANPAQEWSANRETAGAWLELAWDKPQKVSRVLLFDRPNLVDQVKSARIRFSDGSTIEVGELVNDGSAPAVLAFPEKEITSMTFETLSVKDGTENSGLSEIGVY